MYIKKAFQVISNNQRSRTISKKETKKWSMMNVDKSGSTASKNILSFQNFQWPNAIEQFTLSIHHTYIVQYTYTG